MRRRRIRRTGAVPSSGWNGRPAPIDHDPREAMRGYDDVPPEVRSIIGDAVTPLHPAWFVQCVERGIPIERIRAGAARADLGDILPRRSACRLEPCGKTEQLAALIGVAISRATQ